MGAPMQDAETRAARLARALEGLSQIAAAGGKLGQQTDIMSESLASVFDLLAGEASHIAMLIDASGKPAR